VCCEVISCRDGDGIEAVLRGDPVDAWVACLMDAAGVTDVDCLTCATQLRRGTRLERAEPFTSRCCNVGFARGPQNHVGPQKSYRIEKRKAYLNDSCLYP